MLKVLDFTGGAEGDRTPDLMTASHALSQLSYSPSISPTFLQKNFVHVNMILTLI